MTHPHDRKVSGCSGYAVAARAPLGHTDRIVQTDRMRDTALVVLGCHNPDFVGELARDFFKHR
jgi:hypothetical protein